MHSPEGNWRENAQNGFRWYEIKITHSKLQPHRPGSVSWRGTKEIWCTEYLVAEVWTNYVKNGRIRLSVSTVNRTYELSGKTHVTPFRKYGKHSTGPSTYGPWARTYSKLFSCKPVLTVCSYGAQSNEICTYGRVSRGTIPRVRRYGLLYLRTVEYDHCFYLGGCRRYFQNDWE